MNQMQIFNHPMFGELPVLVVDGIEWFGATEAAKSLSFTNPHVAIKNHVEEDDLTVHEVIDNLGRKQSKKFVNESGLYSLIFGAAKQGNNPEIKEKAKRFKRWVTAEVLPSIRKHGAYMTEDVLERSIQDPDFMIGLLTALKDERQKRLAAEQKVEEQKPLVNFAETCMKSEKSLLVREVAKLCTKQGIKIGEKQLWQKLRDWGLVFKNRNEPKQEYMNRGYFEVSQGVKENEKGVFTWLTMRVTPKGQMYIIDRLKKEMEVVTR
ncbi:phage antirepressor KilAC domain-containing protein [Bacillus alveayuensis]|uniref:phage antirepressor KilAC domain-containing protein n=1 Tax=Aeribacillus alveayuensis TaxID=279215 RepID=UPI0005D11E9C|nr:phage antirepressor KilAC domain-containing protein [Bacillus alveayuensis]